MAGSYLYFYCTLHPKMGGKIWVKASNTSAVATNACEVLNGDASVKSYQNSRRLLKIHGALMLVGFGAMLPMGAFMAHTGAHRFHVYWQPTAVLVGVVGISFAFAGVQGGNGKQSWAYEKNILKTMPSPTPPITTTTGQHFASIHQLLGLGIICSALFLQPVAIFQKWYDIHHKNGAFITVAGAMNCARTLTPLMETTPDDECSNPLYCH